MADGLPGGPAGRAEEQPEAEGQGPCVDSNEFAATLAVIASRQAPQFDRLIDDAGPCGARRTHRSPRPVVVSAVAAQAHI